MTVRPPRTTVEKLAAGARELGYKVDEFGPYDFAPDDLHMDLTGNGELFEAWFTRHPVTGYWRFRYGFRHVGVYGDVYPTLAGLLEIIQPSDTPAQPGTGDLQ